MSTCQNYNVVIRTNNKNPLILKKFTVKSPLVIVDSSVNHKMSTIVRESTITRDMHAKIDNWSTEHIHSNKRFHFKEIHYLLLEATVFKSIIQSNGCNNKII